jgi:ribonuclease-3
VEKMKKQVLDELERKLDYTFKNKDLLINALTHKTYAFEAQMPLEYNERLEFLGDSILDFIVAEQIYKSNKFFSEGELTRRRAMIVNNNFLAKKAKELRLGSFLLLGKGERKQNGKSNPTNLANSLEALIGAIYLDSGLNNTKKILLKNILKDSVKF